MKRSTLSLLLVLIAGHCGYIWAEPHGARPSAEELTLFSTHRSEPMILLREFYHSSRILALGESNHLHYQALDYLSDLLKEVGTDPNLKYVVVEARAEERDYLARASLEPAKPSFGVRDNAHGQYYIRFLLPQLRAINAKRPTQPVILVPIDGIEEIEDDGDSVDQHLQRETATLRNFEKQVLKTLGSGGKAIVFYHALHLKKGWRCENTPANWFSAFLSTHPNWNEKAKIIAFDEVDGSWSPEGLFSLTQRLGRIDGSPYAIRTRDFSSVAKEQGWNALPPRSLAVEEFGSRFRSQARLHEMVDGVIWFPSATQKNLNRLEE